MDLRIVLGYLIYLQRHHDKFQALRMLVIFPRLPWKLGSLGCHSNAANTSDCYLNSFDSTTGHSQTGGLALS
jgi:hypothetical protein